MKNAIWLILPAFLSCRSPHQAKLTIAVAANMQYAMQALVQEFNKTDPTKLDIALGASGKLAQQVMHGAPFDVFVSADTKFPRLIADSGYAVEPPEIYARGVLVLWTARPDVQPEKDLRLLLNANIKSIAIANPQTAPYGSAAKSLMEKYGLYDKIASKLVTGESITQTSQYIASQSADIGFTAKSIVILGEMKGKGKWIALNGEDYPPIEQAAVLIKQGSNKDSVEARKFYTFLFSPQAKLIYQQFGYLVK